LQGHNLLKPQIEYHELEEMQGVVGLKAMRVEVNFEDKEMHDQHIANTLEADRRS